jgi:hypothetical protein
MVEPPRLHKNPNSIELYIVIVNLIMSNVSKFLETRHSSYLENILIPETAPVSIPDDINLRHIVKSDVISGNFNTDGNDYMLAAVLNAPSSIVGEIFPYDSVAGVPLGTGVIVNTSQKYGNFFKSARFISADLKISNTTVSTTNFTVSGLVNAIQVPQKLHELIKYGGATASNAITLPTYDQILSIASTGSDKAGAVKMASGAVALALPTNFDVPFVDLNSGVQSNNFAGAPGQPSGTGVGISNSTQGTAEYNDVYTVRFGVNANSATLQLPLTSWDNTIEVVFTGSGSNNANSVTIRARYVDGTTVNWATLTVPLTVNFSYSFTIPAQSSFGSASAAKPMVGLEMIWPNNINTGNYELNALVNNGNLPGATSPTTLMSIVGVPAGSQIAIEGHKNLELIPNEILAQNLPTSYPYYDQAEMSFVRQVMAKREELGIRGVYSGLDYMEKKQVFREISDLKEDDTVKAEAMEILPTLNSIRKVMMPMLTGFLPQSLRPYAEAINSGIEGFLPTGPTISDPSKRRYAYAMEEEEFDDPAVGRDYVKIMKMMSPLPAPPTAACKLSIDNNKKAILFPTIITQDGEKRGVMIYAAVTGRVEPWDRTCSAAGPHHVYNYEGEIPFKLPFDVTCVPVAAFSETELACISEAPVVTGQSLFAALKLLPLMASGTISQTAVTGTVKACDIGLVLVPSTTFSYKQNRCRAMGLDLITPDPSIYYAGPGSALNTFKSRMRGPPKSPLQVAPEFVFDPMRPASAAESRLGLPPLRGEPAKDFFNATMYVSAMYPGYESLPYLVEWMINTGTDRKLTRLMEADPTGDLINSGKIGFINGQAGSSTAPLMKGPDQTTALAAKAKRLYEALKPQYPKITEKWIIENNYAGPSDVQARFISMTGTLPPPGTEINVNLSPDEKAFDDVPGPTGKELATLAKNAEAKIEARIRNDLRLTESAKAALRKFAVDHGRSVTTAEYNHIKSLYASGEVKGQSGTAIGGRIADRIIKSQMAAAGKPATAQEAEPTKGMQRYVEFDDDGVYF